MLFGKNLLAMLINKIGILVFGKFNLITYLDDVKDSLASLLFTFFVIASVACFSTLCKSSSDDNSLSTSRSSCSKQTLCGDS